VLFQSISSMAPAAAVAFTLSAAVPYAGGALPLAIVVAMAACTLLALTIAQLAVHLPSAGGLYAYVSRGLGVIPGFLAGWLLALAQLLIVPLELLVIGPVMAHATRDYLGVASPWWLWALLGTAIVFALTAGGIRLSTTAALILGTGEIAVLLVLSLLLVGWAGGHNTASVFTPQHSRETGLGGWTGVLHGTIFAILAFGGAESAASLAEETANPSRTIPLAIVLSTLCMGALYVLCAYAGVVAWGITNLGSYMASANPWATLGRRVSDVFSLAVVIAILKSAVADTTAGVNVGARVLYAMARDGALPCGLAHVHARYRTPDLAILLTLLAGILLTLWGGAVYGTAAAFGLIGIMMTILFLVVDIAVCASVMAFFRRERPAEFSLGRHVLLPAISAVLLCLPLGAQFYPRPAYPLSLAGPLSALWLAGGMVVALYLQARHPAALQSGGQLFAEGEG
jgi:amino acid transporter